MFATVIPITGTKITNLPHGERAGLFLKERVPKNRRLWKKLIKHLNPTELKPETTPTIIHKKLK